MEEGNEYLRFPDPVDESVSQNCCGFKDAGEINEKERNRVSFLSFLFMLFLIRRTRLILFLLE